VPCLSLCRESSCAINKPSARAKRRPEKSQCAGIREKSVRPPAVVKFLMAACLKAPCNPRSLLLSLALSHHTDKFTSRLETAIFQTNGLPLSASHPPSRPLAALQAPTFPQIAKMEKKIRRRVEGCELFANVQTMCANAAQLAIPDGKRRLLMHTTEFLLHW
jgi:hypothetical protein